MWVMLKTACGCIQWMQWTPEDYGRMEIHLPLYRNAAGGFHVPLAKDIDPTDSKMKVRRFRREAEYRLEGTSQKYVIYEEIVD
jgi:hypothetical protein